MIVVFDANCLLCSYWVRFLLKHDVSQTIRFASLQTAIGKKLLADAGLQVDGLDTLLVLDGAVSFQHTAAIFRILRNLGWPWKLALAAKIVPAPLRDAAYRWIARHRYRLFGRSDTCLMPTADNAHRFLTD